MKQLKLLTSLLVALLIMFSYNGNAQTQNLTPSGSMEDSGWTGLPGNTNLSSTFETGTGIDCSKALKNVATSLGSDTYYILRCEDVFPLTNGDKITVSFWAKGFAANMRLQPWVQESGGNQWMNFGDAYLTTGWVKYQFTTTITCPTANSYKLKFRGYNTGTIHIDNVEVAL